MKPHLLLNYFSPASGDGHRLSCEQIGFTTAPEQRPLWINFKANALSARPAQTSTNNRARKFPNSHIFRMSLSTLFGIDRQHYLA
jgi:hypothetical protein